MKLISAGLTDTGMKRETNEDVFYVDDKTGLYVVCDGLGGHASGEVASRLAVEFVSDFISKSIIDKDITWPFSFNPDISMTTNRLVTAVRIANHRIYVESSEKGENRGMATTIAALLFIDDIAAIAHVGDSRIYKFDKDGCHRLTTDHSLVAQQVKAHQITEEMAELSRYKNVITRALGVKPKVEVDFEELILDSGDYLLLCSDGLTNMLNDDAIGDIVLAQNGSLSDKCTTLIDRANEMGGLDNITTVIVQVL